MGIYKILPDFFDRVIDGNNAYMSNVYWQWRKQYPDSLTNAEVVWDSLWFVPQNEGEWLTIFPEGKKYLSERRKSLKTASRALEIRLKELLSEVYCKYTGFDRWVHQYILKLWLGDLLDEISSEELKLRFLLKPEYEEVKGGGVSAGEIQNARMFPMPSLLGLPGKEKQMIRCIFHSENHPSVSIRRKPDGVWVMHCFGSCSKSWDNISLLQERDGIDFVSAVKKLN